VEFYRDKLGVPLLQTQDGDESYEANVGGVRFVLHPDFDDAVKGHPRGNGILIHLWVPDADAYASLLRERGVSVTEPPEDRPWGRHMAVIDPDGYRVEILAPSKSKSQGKGSL
jgi:predicted enzyme related to lactoylglutathione lyase